LTKANLFASIILSMSKVVAIDLKRIDSDLIGVENLLGLLLSGLLLGAFAGGLFR